MASNIYDVLRKEGFLLDFKIRADKEFQVHKVVLAAHSDFFKAMFRTDMVENKTNEVILNDVKVHILEKVLDFCYTGRLELSRNNVFDLLEAASFLQMKHLKDTCISFIEKNIHDCFWGILSMPEQIQELERKALKFCSDHFSSICMSEDFLNLDCETLKKVLLSHWRCLNPASYSVHGAYKNQLQDRLYALKRWVEVDITNRKPLIEQLVLL